MTTHGLLFYKDFLLQSLLGFPVNYVDNYGNNLGPSKKTVKLSRLSTAITTTK
jgi:hypothetical protein